MLRPVPAVLSLMALIVWSVLLPPPAGAQLRRRPPDPQQLQTPRRAPMTLTPTLTVVEEFNNNVLLNNDDKRWDFITAFTPGLRFELEDPEYRLLAAYDFTAEVYARHPNLNHAFDRHNFLLDGLYRPDPRLTLTLSDTFAFSTDTNLISLEGVATGRDRSWGNSLGGTAAWRAGPRTTLHGGASWTILRFESEELQESDVYRADLGVDRDLTRRLTGTVGYEAGYFRIEHEENLTTHMPRVGITYRFTETITGRLAGGPIVEVTSDDTRLTPGVSAILSQRYAWGSASLDYDRTIGTAGGLGGPTVNQSIGAFVQVITLMKGLIAETGPHFSIVQSHDDRIDVKSFTLPIRATYQLMPGLALVGSYQFFLQRSDSRVTTATGRALANDVDQHRVSLGLQFGYPIRFD